MFLISRAFHRHPIARPVASNLRQFGFWGLTIALSMGSIIGLTHPVVAIETVELQYQDRRLTTTVDRIREYAETGEASEELQTFVGGDTQLTEIVSRLLVEEITLTGRLRDRLREDLQQSSIGQFVLYQLNELIVGSEDLSDLQAAIQASLADDNRLSLLEVAQNYEGSEAITLNLTEVGTVYADVKGFVERVIPALEVAKDYLQDYVCDCETATTATPADSAPETTPETAPETAPETTPDATDAPETVPSEPTDTPQSRTIQNENRVVGIAATPCNNAVSATALSTIEPSTTLP